MTLSSPPTSKNCSAFITAGGQSRRFGSDKALAHWQGRRLLDWVAEGMQLFSTHFLIAPPNKYQLKGFKNLVDARPGEGPLAGLETALSASPTEWIAFAGVDNPALTPEYWQLLLSAWQPETLAIQACDPQGRIQPLGALYHRQLLPQISQHLDAGQRHLRLASPPEMTTVVRGLDEAWFMNMNQVKDLGIKL